MSAFFSVSLGLTLAGCAKDFEGTYNDPKEVEIVDDKWSQVDAHKVASSLINQVLSKPWLAGFEASKKQRPIVVVDEISNRTDEHIDTKALTEAMQDELINANKVRFVNAEKRKQE
jgi:PBP1b-binding outer membrane lipoprotein LpoB